MGNQTYFCWVRVIPATLEGSAYEVDPGSDLFIRNGPKRPKRTGTTTAKQGGSGAIWFDSDEVHYGDPKSPVVFDFGPAFVERGDATGWLGGKGRRWAKEAVNFFLLKIDDETYQASTNQAGDAT